MDVDLPNPGCVSDDCSWHLWRWSYVLGIVGSRGEKIRATSAEQNASWAEEIFEDELKTRGNLYLAFDISASVCRSWFTSLYESHEPAQLGYSPRCITALSGRSGWVWLSIALFFLEATQCHAYWHQSKRGFGVVYHLPTANRLQFRQWRTKWPQCLQAVQYRTVPLCSRNLLLLQPTFPLHWLEVKEKIWENINDQDVIECSSLNQVFLLFWIFFYIFLETHGCVKSFTVIQCVTPGLLDHFSVLQSQASYFSSATVRTSKRKVGRYAFRVRLLRSMRTYMCNGSWSGANLHEHGREIVTCFTIFASSYSYFNLSSVVGVCLSIHSYQTVIRILSRRNFILSIQ